MSDLEIKTEGEAVSQILGQIKAFNDIRIMVWGIGYDNDKTALMIRRQASEQIHELKEILQIKKFGDSWFESANQILDSLNNKQ